MGYMLRYDEIIEASKKYNTWRPHTFVDAVFSKEQLAFMDGANWADHNPINAKIRELHPDFTVEDMMALLSKYPKDAIVTVECCDVKSIRYDEKYNLVSID